MKLWCLLGRHRWRYHGYPLEERRICFTCLRREHWLDGIGWLSTKRK